VLAVAQSEEFGHICPIQIVPRLADQGQYIASSEQHTSSSTVEPSGPVPGAANRVRWSPQHPLQRPTLAHQQLLLPTLKIEQQRRSGGGE